MGKNIITKRLILAIFILLNAISYSTAQVSKPNASSKKNQSPKYKTKSKMNPEIEKAIALLVDSEGKLTTKYKNYLEYEKAYKTKVKELEDARAEAKSSPLKYHSWPMTSKAYTDNVNQAMNQWKLFGCKVDIDNAITLLLKNNIELNILKNE